MKFVLLVIIQFTSLVKTLWYCCTLVPPCVAATSPTHCCQMWLTQTMPPTHCDITMNVYCDVIRPLSGNTFQEWDSHICTCKTTFCRLQIWTKLWVGDFQRWHNLFLEYFLYKLMFSFIQINTVNIKFVIRIYKLNEKVDSTSDFGMFSILCIDFKVNFLRCLEWILNSAMSIYLKFNIVQNGTTNKYERSHFKPNFATYKCMSITPHIYNAVKISMQTAVFYSKICNVTSINHTFWQDWNSLRLIKSIMLLIYNYFANKILFCQTLICELKYLKFSVVPYYRPGLNMALVFNCTTKP